MTRHRIGMLLVVLLLVSHVFAGDRTAPVAHEPLLERVEVDVTSIDLYVTDKKGVPVRGLTRDDFELHSDGRPVRISNFYAVQGGTVALEPDAPTNSAEPAALDADTSMRPADGRPVHLVVYIDNVNLRPAHRARVLDQLRSFLQQPVRRDDRIMLVTFDRSLKIRQAFTSHAYEIAHALDEIEALAVSGPELDADRRVVLDSIAKAPSEAVALEAVETHAARVESLTGFAIGAMQELLEAMAGIPGRKAVLYVSDGLPRIAAEDLFTAVGERFRPARASARAMRHDLSRGYRDLTRVANASDVTIYTLDAGGLDPAGGTTAETAFLDQSRGLVDSIRAANLQGPLRELAGETGGIAIVNTNGMASGLERMASDFDGYYSLGYATPTGSTRYHRVKVRLKRKGLHLRHRAGFQQKTPDTQLLEGTTAALYFGLERNPLGCTLEIERPDAVSGGEVVLPLSIKIPIASLGLVPIESSHRGRVRVSVGVIDEKGRLSPIQLQPALEIQIPQESLAKALDRHYAYSLGLQVRQGRQRIAVAIRDDLTGETSYLEEKVQITGY